MILDVENLDLYYGDARALDRISLQAGEGELVAVVGANGAGKSSLIRTIAGIERPRAGSIRFRGEDIAGRPSHVICNLGIGQVAEARQIFPTMTVEENLEMGGLLPRARRQIENTKAEVFALFPRLGERRRQLAGTMSGGEQQMLAIGRCLMGLPELIMFDEPSLGLSPALTQELFRTIRTLNERGLTIILVEQNVAASLKLADRAYVLENGTIVMHGTGAELLVDDRVRRAYLGIEAGNERPSTPASAPAVTTADAPPYHEISFAPPLVEKRDLPGGGFILRSPVPLGDYPPTTGHLLRRWAGAEPDRVFLAERDPTARWRHLTYAEAWSAALRLGQALLDRGCSVDRPVMALSGNSIDHALLMLGACLAGIPFVPVSVAYSMMSQDHAKLRHVAGEIRPRMIYAASGQTLANALAAIGMGDIELVISGQPAAGQAATLFSDLLTTPVGPGIERAFAGLGPDTIAKVLYTSGSTGLPKGVINTHRMMCANQQMITQTWPFLAERPPVLVDWLPWNHTFGGNHDFNLVLARGGTLWIDEGKPAPGLIDATVRNLREISPTIHFNVPAGYGMLLPHLESDSELAARFFADLRLIFYAGAALSQDLWERLERISVKTTGRRVPMVSSWGATETAPAATCGHALIDRAGVIGLPPPGVELKFVASGEKLEARVKGANVFPGYWKRPDLTAEAFDEDGFYRIGDAARLADPQDPSKGILFDGRIAEDFKLATGTWVTTGMLRLAAITAAAPVIQDAVVTGHDRDFVSLLVWPSAAGMKQVCKDETLHSDPARMAQSGDVREHLRRAFAAHNEKQSGSSVRIERVLLMTTPPSIDANEITDKGYINQRAVLESRAELVGALYADPPPPDVIVIR
ncbi:MAG: AMP-binding protein [Hyphomicrobiaceae bacterium]